MSFLQRIGLAFTLGIFIGTNISTSNGLPLPTAIRNGLIFAIIITIIVALITWGSTISKDKGYPYWFSFMLVLFLNIIGIIILVLLPVRTKKEITK